MEVTGLAVGVVGLAGLFSVCLDSLSRFTTYREANSETHVLDTRFQAARARFEQWGVSVGISNGRLQPDHHQGLDNKETENLIESILQIIAKTICEESILQRTRTGPRLQIGQLGGLSQSRGKRLKWALGGKESRNEQVDIFEKLVQQLYSLIPPENKTQACQGLDSTARVEDIRQMLTKIGEEIKSEMKRNVLSWLGESSPNDIYDDSLSKRVDTTCEWIFDRPAFKSSDPCSKAFITYAPVFWTRHASLSFMDPSLRNLSKDFLKSDNICFKSLVALLTLVSDLGSIFQPQLRPFEFVSYPGWMNMAGYLIEDTDVNEIGALGRSPIFSACMSGSVELVKLLIRHGADWSITDVNGMTCLHGAAGNGFEDIVRILVESNVHLSPQDKDGVTPLHLAAEYGHLECYQYLLEQGSDIGIRDIHGANVIHHACFYAGHSELLRFILQNGPDTLAADDLCSLGSPLLLTARTGDIDMVKVLFEFGAVSSLFVPSRNGDMPLLAAVSSGHMELVELFLEHGVETTLCIPDADGNTALHLACTFTDRDRIISLLLRPGIEASIQMENEEGETPLHVASWNGYASYVKLILQYSETVHQCPLKMQNKKLETPLYLASSSGNVTVVRELLSFGAQTTLSVSNERRRTPLSIAALKWHAEVVEALLDYGADKICDSFNMSSLWAASFGGSSEVVKELLSHGAGRTITASSMMGETPLHAAAFEGNVEVLKLLLEVPGVPVNQKTAYGFSPLFIASRNGYHRMVELLLSVDSVDKESENWLGLGPLFAAVANGHLEVTKLLLSKGYHVQQRVSIGGDLLWWSQRSNKPDLVQLLKTQEALDGTASGSCSPLPGPFTSLERISQDAETIDCEPGLYWCYVCTLSVRNDQEFHCGECDDSSIFVCSECFTRGFKLCQRSHALVPFEYDDSESWYTTDGSVCSEV